MEMKAALVYPDWNKGESMQMTMFSWAVLILFVVGNSGCVSRDLPQIEGEPSQSTLDAGSDADMDGAFAQLDGGYTPVDGGGTPIPVDADLEPIDVGSPDLAVGDDAASFDAELADAVLSDAVVPSDLGMLTDARVPVEGASCEMPSTGFGPWQGAVSRGNSLHQSGCGGEGTEYIVLFTAPVAGNWVFSTSNEESLETDTVLYARDVCNDRTTERACDDDSGDGYTSTLSLSLERNESVYVFVDSWDGSGGDFRLDVEIGQTVGLGERCGPNRACRDGLICIDSEGGTACEEVRERQEGERCDDFAARTGPCAEGLICVSTAGERFGACRQPGVVGIGELCATDDGLVCTDGLVCSVDRICAQPRTVVEGETCSIDGVLQCEDNFACEFIGQLGPFCLPVEVLPEGSICDSSDTLRPCDANLLCVSENLGVPRCTVIDSDCPQDWLVITLDELPMYTAASNTDDSGISESFCRREMPGNVAVFSFTAPAAGDWLFQTGAALGEPDFDTLLEMRTYCSFDVPSTSECNDDDGPGMYSEVRRSFEAQETVYLVVGGFAGRSGTFTIRAVEVQ
jgi:hypothetical protein